MIKSLSGPFFLVLFFSSLLLSAQENNFEPEISNFPVLHPDSLKKYEALGIELKTLEEKDVSYKKMSEEQLALFDNRYLFEYPFNTEPEGCSWYCGAEPSGFFSTSWLESNEGNTYNAINIHDFDLRTAWVENKPGYGIGESVGIQFNLGNTLKITHIDIYNGYCKSEKVWKENSRVKTLAVYINGKKLGKFHLEDTYKRQRFDIGSFGGNDVGLINISFKILDVYKGDKYEDTVISEINFDGTGDH